jgi:hypothetical protein
LITTAESKKEDEEKKGAYQNNPEAKFAQKIKDLIANIKFYGRKLKVNTRN